MKRIKAIYPGSFDPPTNGHLDLIERGSKIFDELVVAILRNPEKDPLFSVADRRKMLEAMTSGFDNVSVDTFDGLTVDYALRVEARAILRGIRDQRSVTVLLVEHHMSLVMQVSDRVVVLDFGRKIAEGAPVEIQRNPDVIRAYLGSDD